MPDGHMDPDLPSGHELSRRLAAVPLLALVVVALVIVAGGVSADVWVGPMPTLEAAVVAATSLVAVLVAVLLLARAGAEAAPRLVGLSTAFLFVAVLVVGHALAFPGIVTARGLWSTPASSPAAWLWLTWHLGFAAAVGLSLLAPASVVDRFGGALLRHRILVAWSAIASSVAAVAVVVALAPSGPALVVQGRVQPALHVVQAVVLAGTVGVAAGILVRRRTGDRLERWMAVALATMVADLVVSLVSTRRYSAGWYVTRVAELATFGLVLVVLLVDIADLYWRTEQQKRRLQVAVTRDSLTGAASRQAILETADRLIGRLAGPAPASGRAGTAGPRVTGEGPGAGEPAAATPAAIAMFDLDHFKAVNDRHGHLVGDEVLAEAALRVAHTLRGGDRVGRYGGEEFLLVMEPSTEEQAVTIAERVRAAIGDEPFSTSVGPVALTASLGVTLLAPSDDLLSAIGRADRALYDAKRAGRDRVVVARAPAAVARGRAS